MIESTFLFLNGIGRTTERRLWEQGILTWREFLEHSSVLGMSAGRKALYDPEVSVALEQHALDNPRFFAGCLKARDHWRLYEWLRPRAVYLDIETAGGPYGEVTVVGLFADGCMTSLVRGDTLTEARLCEEVSRYDLIVTFFGSGFDLPYLQAMFPRLRIDQPHLDLCCAARQVGLRGGLKHIERMVGIEREGVLQGMDGWDAVRMWTRWRHSRDAGALELLLAYNQADCVNLQPLADLLYCQLVQQCRPERDTPRFVTRARGSYDFLSQ
ncbi:MAG: ribonuclease H-like domain-containing protein [Nitrospiraceae bacterium]|nr:ribonuclease H-like domain-containing protein [Nitrospiraceae bacterium]